MVLLSVRDTVRTWWKSMDATVLSVARSWRPEAPGQQSGLNQLLERFAGTADWDDQATLMVAYERHVENVRATVSAERLVEWRPGDGWAPLCRGLGVAEPDEPFPWRNRRADWR